MMREPAHAVRRPHVPGTGAAAGFGAAAYGPGQRLWRTFSILGTALVLFVFSAAAYGLASKYLDPRLATLSIAASYGFGLLAMLVEWPRVAEAARRHWYLIIVPAFAVMSFLWSEAPGHSLRMSLQLCMTILLAVVLGAANSPLRLMHITRNVIGIAVLFSLAVILADHPRAFDSNGLPSGVFPHKNLFGQCSALLALLALQLMVSGGPRGRNLLWLALGTTATLVSQSALSLVLLLVGTMMIVVLNTGRGSLAGRLLVLGPGLLAAGLFAAALVLQHAGLTETVLGLLGKSETLTGRTILWEHGWSQVMEKPLLGSGYLAFWHEGVNPDALYISGLINTWRHGVLLPHFHNGFLQLMVDLGFVGMALSTMVFLVFIVKALAEYRRGETALAGWPLVLIAFVLVANFAEYGMFKNHELLTVYLAATVISHSMKYFRFRPNMPLVRPRAPAQAPVAGGRR